MNTVISRTVCQLLWFMFYSEEEVCEAPLMEPELRLQR